MVDAKARQDCIKEIELLKVEVARDRYLQAHMFSGCLSPATEPSKCDSVHLQLCGEQRGRVLLNRQTWMLFLSLSLSVCS